MLAAVTSATTAALVRRLPPQHFHNHNHNHKGHHFPFTTYKPSLTHSIKHLTFTPKTTTTTVAAASSSSPAAAKFSLPPLALPSLETLTPLTITKYIAVAAVASTLVKQTLTQAFNPFLYTNISLFLLKFYPWLLALSFSLFPLHSLLLHPKPLSPLRQLSIVSAAIMWLTIIPSAHFNGFLDAWPITLFLVYHYFFFFESSVRRRLYGDLLPRLHDPKWDITMPRMYQIIFSFLIVIGHWLAAYEGPETHLIGGGWANACNWGLVLVTLFMRYHSVLYLAKYSEKVAQPTAVVHFGPYRWVRHPVYASTMLLFAVNCIVLRAPLSLLFLTAVGVLYYGRKAELEEELMVETFGERYTEYMNKVRYKLIPFVY